MSSILPPYLTYYQEYGLIICSTHQLALHKTKIFDHMTKIHHETAFDQSDLDSLHLASLATTHHMITSEQPVSPIPMLKPPQPGFQCKQCNLIRLSQKAIRDHVFQAHLIRGYQAQDLEIASCLVQALEGSAYLFSIAEQSLKLPKLPTRKRSRELSLASTTLGPTTQRSRVDSLSLP